MKRSLLMFLMLIATGTAFGQGRGGGGRGAPPTGKSAAPFDATGYWVSIVGEDWRWRMFPNKGDYGAAPLNGGARKIADSWDPAKDAAAGEQCKGYAAPVVMRVPGRLHVTWQDDQTLKIETDAGTANAAVSFRVIRLRLRAKDGKAFQSGVGSRQCRRGRLLRRGTGGPTPRFV